MAVLATLLFGVTLLVTQWEPGARDPDATEAIWDLEVEDVAAVTLVRPDATIVLEMLEGVWHVTAPYAARADDERMLELLDSIREIERGTPIQAPGDHAEFGLEPPTATLEVHAAGGAVHRLEIGDEAAVGYQTYARTQSGVLVSVRGSHSGIVSEPLRAWRDHRAFRFDPALVRGLRIDGPEGVLATQGEGDQWWLDGFTRVDLSALDVLVYGLLDIRVADFLQDAAPLEETTFVVTVELVDGTEEVLRVGGKEGGGIRVDLAEGLPAVAVPQTLTLLVQGPTDLGDASAFVVEPEETDHLRLSGGENVWEATRDGNEWLVEGLASAAPHGVLGSLDAASIHYRWASVPTVVDAWLVVETGAGAKTRTVKVGPRVDDTWYAAQDLDGGEPYLIPVDDLEFVGELGFEPER
jgi:hypothetical protein